MTRGAVNGTMSILEAGAVTIKQKLKNSGGFSLAEMLMAVLIMLLVALIMANGVPVAKKAYEKVVLTANAQTMLSTAVASLRDELGTAWDIDVPKPNPQLTEEEEEKWPYWIEYYSADTGARTQLYIDIEAGKAEGEIMKREYSRMDLLNTGANSFEAEGKPLVTAASKENMKLTCESITYAGGVVTVGELKVSRGDTILASQSVLKIRVFSEELTSEELTPTDG